MDISAAIKRIPMLRWGAIVARYGINLNDVQNPDTLPYLMVVIANEIGRATTGVDNWERFEAMGIEEIGEFIAAATGSDEPANEPADSELEAIKS